MQERGNEIEHLPAFIIHTAYEHETVCLGFLCLFRLFLFHVLCVGACLTLYTVFSPILIVFSSSISMFMQPICTLPLHVCYFGYYILDSTIHHFCILPSGWLDCSSACSSQWPQEGSPRAVWDLWGKHPAQEEGEDHAGYKWQLVNGWVLLPAIMDCIFINQRTASCSKSFTILRSSSKLAKRP